MKTPQPNWYFFDGQWHHVVVVREGPNKGVYLDGQKVNR